MDATCSICVLEMEVFLKIVKSRYQKAKEIKYILYIKNSSLLTKYYANYFLFKILLIIVTTV